MANQGDYRYQSNFRDSEQNRESLSSLFDMRSPTQDKYSSQGLQQSSNYQGGSGSRSYGGSSNQGGYASRHNSDAGYLRRGEFREETFQQSSYPPQAKTISNLFDVPSNNNYERFERIPESTYKQNQDRAIQSGSNYQHSECDYQQKYSARVNQSGSNYRERLSSYQEDQVRVNQSGNNYRQVGGNYQENQDRVNQSENNYRQPGRNYQENQDRVNQSGNNYRQPYQANQFGRKPISDMFDVPSNADTFGGQSKGNYGQYQDRYRSEFQRENETETSRFYQETHFQDRLSSDQRGSNNSGSSYRVQDQSSKEAFSRNADFHQKYSTNTSNLQQTPGSSAGKFVALHGRRKNRLGNHKPYSKVGTEIKQEEGQELSQHEKDHNRGVVKEFVCKIDPSLIVEYKAHPPSVEEMGDLFKGFVVFFHWKEPKSLAEKNPFVVICESFRKSDRFDELQVEDGFQQGDKFTKYCTMRYQGMMMARGAGNSGNLKEPRVMAAIDLINKLAMTCYTLKVKDGYFHRVGLPKTLKLQDIPGVYRIVPEEDVPDITVARKMVTDLVESDSDCELAFTNPNLLYLIKCFSREKTMGCETRCSKEAVIVCKARTPQYWRDKILASGEIENKKFTLLPPQGLRKNLLGDTDISKFIPKLKTASEEMAQKIDPYSPEVRIQPITVPWEQRSFIDKQRKNNRNNKRNRIRKRK